MPALDLTQPNEQHTRWSLLLGILIWFLHLNVINALISVSCKWGVLTVPVGGLSGLQILVIVITLITVGLLAFLIYLPWRYWNSLQTERPTANPDMLRDTEEQRQALMAFVAMLLNGFLILYTIATFVPMLSLKACGQA